MLKHKRYLGDAVYAAIDTYRGMVVLTTEDGYGPTNTIYLEPEVVKAFELWLAHVRAKERVQNE